MDELLWKCLQGDKRAWEAFVDRCAPIIFATVRRVMGGRVPPGRGASAEDIAQDVFLRLVQNDFRLLRSYDPARASLATWLTIVARSVTTDFVRRRPLPTVALDDAPPIPAPAPAGGSPDPVNDLPADLLSPRQRLVLHLLFDRQMTPEAAAAAMGISLQTVRSAKHKAIKKLREHFSPEDFR